MCPSTDKKNLVVGILVIMYVAKASLEMQLIIVMEQQDILASNFCATFNWQLGRSAEISRNKTTCVRISGITIY